MVVSYLLEGLLLDMWKQRPGWSRRQEPPRAPPRRLPHHPQLHHLLTGAGHSCRPPAHQPPCTHAVVLPSSSPKRASGHPIPPDGTPWHLLPHGGRDRRQTSSRKHSGGVLQEGRGHGGGWRAMIKPGNPRNNIILLVASRMGLGPAPQGVRPYRTKRTELFMED